MSTYKFVTSNPPEAERILNYGGKIYQINNRYLTKNGKPWLPMSGELHYSRLPREMWSAELDKMKAAGLSIISTYIFWIHHEEEEGLFLWDGNRNLGEFIDLCHEKGLEVSLRIGPWSHGECRNGGFPDWLLEKCGGKVRCNAEPYLTFVEKYYKQVKEHLQDRKLFSIQIENELVSDIKHLETLYDLAREIGFEADLFTATAWGFDMRSLAHKLLPTFGGYPEQPWNQSTGKSLPNPHFFFTGVRSDSYIGNDLQPLENVVQDEGVPYFTCEIGPGVQVCYHRRPIISAEDALSMVVDTLGDGCNWLGMYMFHGGSNPIGKFSTMQESVETGYPNECPVISYDFQAPIGESGYLRESYYRLQSIGTFLQNFGENLAPMVPFYPDCQPTDLEDTETLRCCLRSNGYEGFMFINNHHHGKKLPEHRDIHLKVEFADRLQAIEIPCIPSDVTFLFPVGMRMDDSVMLDYALAQPLSRDGNDYWFEKIDGIEPIFKFSDGSQIVIRDTASVGGVNIHVRQRVYPEKKDGRTLTFRKEGEYHWSVDQVPEEAGIVEIDFYGDKLSVYADGKLIADQFYYGDCMRFYKAKNITSLEVHIQPLEPEKDIYFECERRNGGNLEGVHFFK